MLTLLEGHSNGIVQLADDERYLYSGSKDRSLRIWDKDSLDCVHVIDGFPCGCKGVSDGGSLYTITAHGTKNKYFAEWERGSWTKRNELTLPADADLEAIALDAHHVFVSARDGKVFVIDRQATEISRVLQQSSDGIWDIATDEDNLYTASVDQSIRVWDKTTWEVVDTLRGHNANIQSLAVDDTYLYSIATDKTVIVWDKQTGNAAATMKKIYGKGMLGLLSAEDHLLVLNTSQGLKVWRKGQWDVPENEYPSITTNRGLVDTDRVYFGFRDGNIGVYQRTEVGIGSGAGG